jgi:hypothetical protein
VTCPTLIIFPSCVTTSALYMPSWLTTVPLRMTRGGADDQSRSNAVDEEENRRARDLVRARVKVESMVINDEKTKHETQEDFGVLGIGVCQAPKRCDQSFQFHRRFDIRILSVIHHTSGYINIAHPPTTHHLQTYHRSV